MNGTVLFLIMSVASCSLLLLSLPWVVRTSPEAERMFALVTSSREDKRRIGLWERCATFLAKHIGQVRTRLNKGKNDKAQRRFAEAGLRGPNVADLFFLAQVLGSVSGAILGSFLPSEPVFWSLAVGTTGFIAPGMALSSLQRRRRNRIRRSIPDMVDLLVICVGAGLGLDQALLRVSEELSLSHPDLTEELERAMLERRAGASRIDAWRALAERTRIEELGAFVSMLSETDRFGSPILTALSAFSDELRTKRRQHAEEAAAKTKVKIIFPLVLCIFPCIFIVLLIPAMLNFYHGLSGLSR